MRQRLEKQRDNVSKGMRRGKDIQNDDEDYYEWMRRSHGKKYYGDRSP